MATSKRSNERISGTLGQTGEGLDGKMDPCALGDRSTQGTNPGVAKEDYWKDLLDNSVQKCAKDSKGPSSSFKHVEDPKLGEKPLKRDVRNI